MLLPLIFVAAVPPETSAAPSDPPPPPPFRELYDAQFRFVWRTLRRLGVPDRDLPDAVQEVFVVVHRKLPEFQGRARITTWLFRIALRVASDRGRRAHVRREVATEVGLELARDPRPPAHEALEQRESLALFDAALAELELDQRAVFTLFELEGLPGGEIAEILAVPLGTVWSRLRLGREHFRRAVVRHAARQRGHQEPLP